MRFSFFLSLLLLASNSHAVYEDLSTSNSTYDTAQYLASFSVESDIHIFGVRGEVDAFGTTITDNDDADYYSFDVAAGTTLLINILTPEGPTEYNDPILGLLDNSGAILLHDDDSHVGDGYDSYLTYYFASAGTYILAVSGYEDFNFNGIHDSLENDDLTDDSSFDAEDATNFLYTVDINVAPVPVPAAVWLFGTGIISMAGFSRRKAV